MRAALVLSVAGVVEVAACGPPAETGSCEEQLIAGDLVITEVFADYQAAPGTTGTDEGNEWIEIYNASGRALALRGLAIVHGRPDGTKQNTHVMDDVTIAAGQFFTLGNAAQDLVPPYIDYGYAADLGDLFNSDGGKVELRCGTTAIDAAIYDTVKSGHSRQLTASQPPDYTLNDDALNWCEAAATEFEARNFGTPGQDNDCTPVIVGRCDEGGATRDVVSPAPGELVITEVMPSPATVDDALGEWFEARAMKDLDLNGLGLDRAGDTIAKPSTISVSDCLRVAAGTHVVFARNADPAMNGNVTARATFGFTLVGGTPAAPGDVRILSGETVIDAVSWTASRNGRSLALDPDLTNDTANDDLGNYCDGSAAYHTVEQTSDFGSPGAANAQCALLPAAGQCLDNGTPRAIVKPAAGALVITEFMANPAGADTAQEWFEIKNTGATGFDLNGLSLKGNATTVNVVTAADCKRVAPGGHGLFARSADPAQNSMLPAVDGTFSFALVQSNGTLSVSDGTIVLDAITWAAGIQDGASRQLQPAATTTTANDDPAMFCNALASQPYGTGTNFGTPKAVNACM